MEKRGREGKKGMKGSNGRWGGRQTASDGYNGGRSLQWC